MANERRKTDQMRPILQNRVIISNYYLVATSTPFQENDARLRTERYTFDEIWAQKTCIIAASIP